MTGKRKIEWTPAADTRAVDVFVFGNLRVAEICFPHPSRPDSVLILTPREPGNFVAGVRGRMVRNVYDFNQSPDSLIALVGERQLSTGRVLRLSDWEWLKTKPPREKVEEVLGLIDRLQVATQEWAPVFAEARDGR